MPEVQCRLRQDDHDMVHRSVCTNPISRGDEFQWIKQETYYYKVVNIIQEHVTKVKHLLHSLLQVIINQ